MDYLAERSLNIYDRSIDAQVSRLRTKLRDKGPNFSLIRTMRGDGYMLTTPVERRAL
jgi:two-component system OmpR family response regulator